jgi:trans-aconitate 2-methyltransferase
MTSRSWDGRTYDRIGTPQAEWGRVVLDRLPLAGDETVVDAGCGSGRVTELLLERLPHGRVLAVDGSASMIDAARERLGDRPNVEFLVADLLELDLGGRRVDAVLRPGGRLVAQCGGRGNIARVLARAEAVMREPRWAARFEGYVDPHRFAGPEETEALLRGAGFDEARCWLQEAPVHPPEPPVFLGSVILGVALERLPEEEREAFVADVLAGLPEPFEADYVRLNLDAIA